MRRSKKLLRQRASADDETWLGVNHDGDPVKEVNRMDSVDDNSTMKDIKQSMSSSLEKDSKPVCSVSSLSLTDSLKSLLDNAGLRFHLKSDGKVVLLSYYLVSKPY